MSDSSPALDRNDIDAAKLFGRAIVLVAVATGLLFVIGCLDPSPDHWRLSAQQSVRLWVLCAAMGLIALALARGASRMKLAGSFQWLIGLAALVILLRDPMLFLQPRFWAEEATVYLRAAWDLPIWRALIAPHQGYYSLFANVASLLALLPPLEWAPLVTTILAGAVLLLMVGLIAVSQAPFLRSTRAKALATAALLVMGSTPEIWLTTINSQHLLPVLVFLMLIDEKQSAIKRRIYCLLALCAGLSGVATNFLAPLFLARYLVARDKGDRQLFLILAATASVQLTAILYSAWVLGPAAYFHASQSRALTVPHWPTVLRTMWDFGVAYPLFGTIKGGAAVLAQLLLLLVLWLSRRALSQLVWGLSAIVLLTVLTVAGSLGMAGGPRYAYPAAVILGLCLLQLSVSDRLTPRIRHLNLSLLCVSLVVWAFKFSAGAKEFSDPTWPTWRSEVQLWRQAPGHLLQAFPLWPNQAAKGLVWAVPLRRDSVLAGGVQDKPGFSATDPGPNDR